MICFLRIESQHDLYNLGLYINDLSLHDATREFAISGTNQLAEMKKSLIEEKNKSKILENNSRELIKQKNQADDLLYRLLPPKIAYSLRNGMKTENLCEVVNRKFV